jgi:hypothetical protein
MNEIRELLLKQLRTGSTPAQVCIWLEDLRDELITSAAYIQAIKEKDLAP